jgi:hypothetical protein
VGAPLRNLGYGDPQNACDSEACDMPTTDVVNLDAMIRRADLASPGRLVRTFQPCLFPSQRVVPS